MPEHRRHRLLLAVAGGLLATGVAAAPAVLAQSTDPSAWDRSELTTPFRDGFATVTTESFPIAGVFHKDREPLEEIVQVQVRYEHAIGSSTDPADGCIPVAPAPFVGQGTTTDDTASFAFEIPAEASVWPCNGRFRVIAAAQSNQAVGPHELVGELAVAVPPAAITSTSARWDGPADVVEVVWQPLAEEDAPPDLVGYRVERAGPGRGSFTAVGHDVGADAETVVLDEDPTGGTYRYRVRAIRSGPDGPVLSQGGHEVEVVVPGAPAEPTTTTRPDHDRPRRPQVNRGAGVASGRVTPRLPSPPTTADTGFEETLDYGAGDAPGIESDGEELAGQGQAIIRTDDEGAGLLAPAAGALVLLGWAGHVAYLNRLARQF